MILKIISRQTDTVAVVFWSYHHHKHLFSLPPSSSANCITIYIEVLYVLVYCCVRRSSCCCCWWCCEAFRLPNPFSSIRMIEHNWPGRGTLCWSPHIHSLTHNTTKAAVREEILIHYDAWSGACFTQRWCDVDDFLQHILSPTQVY